MTPSYMGRILRRADAVAVGTCFQVTPGFLVTAWHVLDDIGCAAVDAEVDVDELGAATTTRTARVLHTDELHDLAVLAVTPPLPDSIGALGHSERIRAGQEVQLVGVPELPDKHAYRYAPAFGRWRGLTMRVDEVRLATIDCDSVLTGMSGAPVRRVDDDVVVGVVSGRYNSPDDWYRATVWLSRVEDLLQLLKDAAVPPPRVLDGYEQVRSYVSAAVRAAEPDAYLNLLGRASPPLSTVYLRQLASIDDGRPGGEPARVSAEDLVEMDEDCLVVSGPGGGKSTLLRLCCLEAGARWASGAIGDAVPIRLLASDLVGGGSPMDLIADAVRTDTGWDADAGFFARPPGPGIRWLLLVDGLDEILDPATRRAVLSRTATLSKGDSAYRIILATRPVDEAEPHAVLAFQRWAPRWYELQPFEPDRVTELAAGWFRVSGLAEPERRAEELVEELNRRGLAGLARTPLMATMLCQLRIETPTGPLPSSRGQIYHEFVRCLHKRMHADRSGIRGYDHLGGYGNETRTAVDRTLDSLPTLVEHLATVRRDGDSTPAMRILAARAETTRPSNVFPEDWQEFLASALRRTGLLTVRGHELVFWHQTLRDYLAARNLPDRTAVLERLLGVSVSRRSNETSWRPPDEDPSYVSFVVDPGRADEPPPDDLLERLALSGGLPAQDFIITQAQMGTRLPAEVVARVVREVTAAAAEPGAVAAARVLARADRPAGLARLVQLSMEPSRVRWRFDAIRAIAALDLQLAATVLRDLALADLPVSATDDQVAAAVLLADIDRDAAALVLSAQARTRRWRSTQRLHIVRALLTVAPAEGLAAAEALARDATNVPAIRMAAAQEVARWDRPLGIELLAAAAEEAITRAIDHRQRHMTKAEIRRDFGSDVVRDVHRSRGSNRAALRDEARTVVKALAAIDQDRTAAIVDRFAARNRTPGGDRRWLRELVTAPVEPQRIDSAAVMPLSADDRYRVRRELGNLYVRHLRARRFGADDDAERAHSGTTLPAGLVSDLTDPGSAELLDTIARDPAWRDTERFTAAVQLAVFRDPRAPDLLTAFAANDSLHVRYRTMAAMYLTLFDRDLALRTLGDICDGPGNFFDRLAAVERTARVDHAWAQRALSRLDQQTQRWRLLRRYAIRLARRSIATQHPRQR